MVYKLDFSLAGLIFLLLVYIFLRIQYDIKSNTVKYLSRLLLGLFFTDLFDIITAVTISYSDRVPLWINIILNLIFFELEIISLSYLPKYIQYVLEPVNGKKILLDKINDVLIHVYIVLCATTYFTHLFFYFDENKKYQTGPLYLLIYIIPIYLLLYSSIRLILSRKSFNSRQFTSIISFIFISIMGSIIQYLWMRNHLFAYFAVSVASFIIVFGLETPDYIQLQETLSELEKHKDLLEKAKLKEEKRNKDVHAMTKTASWNITMNKELQPVELYWSDEFFWMLGYENVDDAGGTEVNLWMESLHPEEKDSVMDSFTKGMMGVAPYDRRYRLRSKNGEYKWYRGTGELEIDAENGNRIYQGIIQDITDEKIKEDLTREKLEAIEELEKSQQALKEAVIRAETADKAKSDFLANMSHEIRTPINAVLGMNELIRRESNEDDILSYSANISDAGQALLSLINDILDFSKIEAGKMELAPADYELSVLIREVNNMINIRCNDKGLKFIINNNPDIPNRLYGDEVRMRQILINILNNAIKYTEIGSVTLGVDFERIDDEHITLILSAKDTGIGIKKENLPDLFDSFKRIDLEHNRKVEGTGLGLSITKSFIDLMGGTIDVDSVYGEGSTFTVRIPQIVKGDEKIGVFDNSLTKPSKSKYKATFKAPEARILVVDDVSINLRVIKGLLKQTEIKVDTVDSGAECLDAISSVKYDVIFLDHMMPEMDGIETMRRIKQDTIHVNQTTPIVMLTANAIIGAKEEYLDMGFVDYLSKPVRSEELEELLIRYLPDEKIIDRKTE